jgi:teichoic acid transport system permease protein
VSTQDFAEIARASGLERVGLRPPLGRYLRELWGTRHFAFTLARYRVQANLGENRLGLAWVVLRPVLQAAVFGFVFGVILPASSRPDNFIPFLVVGIFFFQYFSKTFSAGAKSITKNAALVRSLSFPRMLLPVAAVLQELIEFVPAVVVMVIIVLATGEPLVWTFLLLPVTLVVMTLFNAGIALIAARLTVHVRDVTQIIPVLTRLLFYSSGIFYSLELVLADRPGLLRLAQLNPVHDFIALARSQTVSGNPSSVTLWGVAVGATVVLFITGVLFFWKAEERYGHD